MHLATRLLKKLLFCVWLGLFSVPLFAQTSFEGWVRYESQTSGSANVEHRSWDTLFITGHRAVSKYTTVRTYHLTREDVTRESFLYFIYAHEERQSYFHHTHQYDKPFDWKPASETIFPDSIEQLRRPKVEVFPLDSTKVILGYLCRQAEVRLTFPRPDTLPNTRRTIVFYTDQLPNVWSEFKGLGGLPLEYWSHQPMPGRPNGFWYRYTATAIGRGPVPEAYFDPKSLYPGLRVTTTVWDGVLKPLQMPEKRVRPVNPKSPSQLRKAKKKYPWSANG